MVHTPSPLKKKKILEFVMLTLSIIFYWLHEIYLSHRTFGPVILHLFVQWLRGVSIILLGTLIISKSSFIRLRTVGSYMTWSPTMETLFNGNTFLSLGNIQFHQVFSNKIHNQQSYLWMLFYLPKHGFPPPNFFVIALLSFL